MKWIAMVDERDKRRGLWHDGGVAADPVPAVPRALAPRSLPDPAGDRALPAAPEPGPAARAGLVGLRRAAGRQRLPGGGRDRPGTAGRRRRGRGAAPAAARVALRWGRPGRPRPGRGRRSGLVRPAAGLGAGVV